MMIQIDSPPTYYFPAMQKLLNRVEGYLVSRHHTGAMTTLDRGTKNGLLRGKDELVLMNVDSHSDLFRYDYPRDTFGIADWVNAAIYKYPQISEFIWVMPEEISETIKKQQFQDGDLALALHRQEVPLYIHKRDNTTYLGKKPYIPVGYAEEIEKYRALKLRLITAGELPSLIERKVFLSVDLDAFSNLGRGTINNTKVPYQGERQVISLLQHLEDKINPFLLNISYSPRYSYVDSRLSGFEKIPVLHQALQNIQKAFVQACPTSAKKLS